MATNPMQKKARNSFLLGMVLMLIIVAIIGAIVYLFVIAPQQKTNKNAAVQTTSRDVYVIKQEVKSGEDIIVGINAEKQKIETGLTSESIVDPTGTKAKIDLPTGTIVTSSMLMLEDTPSDDTRLMEFNMITLPTTLGIGDYIDVRITMPSGQDYIVVSKKEVKTMQGNTIGLYLTEAEILTINCAITEGYIMTASNIYAILYVEPGTQEQAIPTYPVNPEVYNQIIADSNIINSAKKEFLERYQKSLRDSNVNNDVNSYSDNRLNNIETGIQEQVEKAKEAREQYLTGVSAY